MPRPWILGLHGQRAQGHRGPGYPADVDGGEGDVAHDAVAHHGDQGGEQRPLAAQRLDRFGLRSAVEGVEVDIRNGHVFARPFGPDEHLHFGPLTAVGRP